MSFLKRLIISFFLLLFLGLPLSITYYETAQSLPSPVDEVQPAQQLYSTTAGEETPGTPVPQESQEEEPS